jgi:hypothetical protein
MHTHLRSTVSRLVMSSAHGMDCQPPAKEKEMSNDITASMEERIASLIKSDQAAMVQRLNDFIQQTSTKFVDKVAAISGVVSCSNITSVVTDFSWTDVTQEIKDSVLYDQVYDNSHGSDKMTPTFTFSKSYQDSHTFKFTEGLKVGAKTTISADLPYLVKGEVEISAEASFSAEQSFTYTDTKTWTMSVPVEVLPGTVARVTGYLNMVKQNARFNAKQRVTDGIAMVWITDTLFQMKQPAVYPVRVLLTDRQREFNLSGTIDNIEGVSCNLTQTSE